ncbi:MAG TPA: ABC transporter permease, partial [Vicinamibacterales bacterium]
AYRDLVRHLLLRDLRHKYKGSSLGFVWSLANPLLMAAVYTIAFKFIVRLPIERFALFLVSGLLPWTFFAGGLSAATASIVDNGSLVRKVAFPRLVLPVAAVLSQFVQFALTYAIVIPILVALEGGGTTTLVAVLPVLVLQLVFTTGLGLMLAAAYVHARDTRHLLDVALQLWFWLTPVVYSMALVPETFGRLLHLNPMTAFMAAYHAAVADGTWPAAWVWSLLLVFAAAAAWLGLIVFTKAEPTFAERL